MMKRCILLLGCLLLGLLSCEKEDSAFQEESQIESDILKLAKKKNIDLVVKSNLNKRNAIELNSIDELEAFIDSVQKTSSEETSNPNKGIENSRNISRVGNCYGVPDGGFSASTLLAYARLNFFFSASAGYIYDVSPSLSGITLGAEYTMANFYPYIGGGEYYANVHGTLEYTLFVQGIGTIYSEPMGHRLVFICPYSVYRYEGHVIRYY